MPERGVLTLFDWNDIHGCRLGLNADTWCQPIYINTNINCRKLVDEIETTLRKHWRDRAGYQIFLIHSKIPNPKVKSVRVEWRGQEEDTLVYFQKDIGKDDTSFEQSTDDLDMETIWKTTENRHWKDRFYVRYNLEEEADGESCKR